MEKDATYQQQQTDHATPLPVESSAEPPPLLWSPALEREQRSKGTTQGTAVALSLSGLAEQKSAGPVLEITDGHGELDRPFASLYLRAVMAYPREAGARDEFLATVKADMGAALQGKGAKTPLEKAVLAAQIQRWIEPHGGTATLSRAPGWPALSRQIASSTLPGLTAGLVLRRAVQIARMGFPSSVNKAVTLVAQAMQNASPVLGRTPKSWRRILAAWQRYRPAAHLWAATDQWLRVVHTFPLVNPPESIPAFLAFAEIFRRLGLSLHAHGQPTPILDPAETWQPPPDLSLPDLKLTVPPLEDWAIETLRSYTAGGRPL